MLLRLISLTLGSALALAGATSAFHLVGDEPGPWPRLLSSIGLQEGEHGANAIYVVRQGSQVPGAGWQKRVTDGAFLILEGQSAAAAEFGFRPTAKNASVRNVQDLRAPKLAIIWEKALTLPVFEVPKQARLFARERWDGAPLLAGYRQGQGAVLWVASSPGTTGQERYPYLLQALVDLGMEPVLRGSRLWAFFDSAYRQRVDLDYFAERWQQAGISTLQVAAWHYFEPNPEQDAYLVRLIEACHRRGILVSAWLELPHVSERFWADHPEWREKTALQQDAQLDWRKLMNLANPDCRRAVATGTQSLLDRFEWDGVNLAELYFESLEGIGNPARFTPMNQDVRHAFQQAAGYDPMELFQPHNARATDDFLNFRAELARRMQVEWLGQMEQARRRHPDLSITLTHVDDRYDPQMRKLIGADAGRLLPLLRERDFTFLVEDPATLWSLGAERYGQMAARYRPITPKPERLAIDINVVERYQDVYPTKQQTGAELFALVHSAAHAFSRVALYFENSILNPDWPLLPAAAAQVTRLEHAGEALAIDSPRGVGVRWTGPLLVDGQPWPLTDGATAWLPAGPHALLPGGEAPAWYMRRFTGDLRTLHADREGLQFSYESDSRAMALLDQKPNRVMIDGEDTPIRGVESPQNFCLYLPRGQHLVEVFLKLTKI